MEFFFCYANYTFLLFWMLVFGDGCEAPGIYFGYWDRVAELHQSWLSGIDLVFLIFVIVVELLQWLFICTMVSRVHFNLVLKDKNGEKWRALSIDELRFCSYENRFLMLFQLLAVLQLMQEFDLSVSPTSGNLLLLAFLFILQFLEFLLFESNYLGG